MNDNLRNQEIELWLTTHRPDLLVYFTNPGSEAFKEMIELVSAIGFEAGRQFQLKHPDVEIGNPSLYLQSN